MADVEIIPPVTEKELRVGLKIKAVRELQNVSQDFLARSLNIGQSTLSKIESGETPILFDRLYDIALALNVNVNMIINFDKDVFFYHCSQSGMHNQVTNNHYHAEEIKDMYERIIKEKDSQIELLKSILPK